MTIRTFSILLFLIAVTVLFQQCSKSDPGTTAATTITQPKLPASPYNYNIAYPAHIQNALLLNDNTPSDNPLTNDGATLGRVLFYDKNLSKNNTISCASCHKPETFFSDDARLSKGFAGGLTARHAMALMNLRFYKSGKMFWDERAPSIEKQALQPIQNTVEMGLTLAELESKVAALNYYPALFQKAFGSAQIDSVKISKALAQFERSIVTWQSKYDLVKQGLASFTPDEAAGEQLFTTPPPPGPGGPPPSCAGCHTPPMFLTSAPAGPFALLDPNDHGINNQDRFKSGSLRNITNTAPYFHNGTITSLTAMLTGGIPAHSVPPPAVVKVLAFLQTLSDASVSTDPRFSDPFK